MASKTNIQTTNQITGKQKGWALATVLMTMFFASMNQTVVSTAIPTIISDLEGFELYSWIFSAFMITSAISVPIYGKLSDVYGRRPFYIFGLLVFAIGSVLSGFSQSIEWLIIARAIQGIGAGAMMSMPRATIGDIFNPKERGRWMGVIGAVFGVSSILGPTIGGWITENIGWEWVFFVNLPFAVLALIGVFYALPKVKTEQRTKVDWIGSILLTIGLLPIMFGFTWAGDKYAWSDWQTITLFGSGLIVLVFFMLYERKRKDPVIEVSFFQNKLFAITLILAVFVTMAMFGALMFLPLYIQGVLGMSVQNSGLVMAPMMISFIAGSVIAGQYMTRTGKYKMIAHISAVFMVVGLILFSLVDVDTTYPTVILDMVILGIGIGSLMPIFNVSVQNIFPYKQMGSVNATQQFVRSLGGVIAAPIFGSLLNSGFSDKMKETMPSELANLQQSAGTELANMNPQALLTQEAQQGLQEAFAKMGDKGIELFEQFLHAVKVSLSSGIHSLFIVGLGFAILTLIGTFFMPEHDLQGDEYYEKEADGKA
ncbi:MDR family MFS transporter [Ornithinibacillus xuwenensis]|uniref:DHA2 family efflux MFS transporter permease subunit n=1 Tax=Ornithinibacillus xuwenensis TaxID=3144668 RepID=A0ABU9XJ84_9BACI